eukprot:tig00000863_g4993.t1
MSALCFSQAFHACWQALTPSRRPPAQQVDATGFTPRQLVFDEAEHPQQPVDVLPRLSEPPPPVEPAQPPPDHDAPIENSVSEPEPKREPATDAALEQAAAATRIAAAYRKHLKRRALDPGPVEAAPSSSVSQLEDEMDWIARCLLASARDTEWSLRVLAMRRLQALALGGPENTSVFESRIGPIVPGLIQQACDLRSSVVKDACNAISALAKLLGPKFEPHAETIVPALFKLLFVTIKAISEAGNACIRSVLQSSAVSRAALSAITDGATAHKHGATRQRCAEYMLLLLESAAARERLAADPESRERLAAAIQRCLADAQAGVRETARRCFAPFRGIYGASHADAGSCARLRRPARGRPRAGPRRRRRRARLGHPLDDPGGAQGELESRRARRPAPGEVEVVAGRRPANLASPPPHRTPRSSSSAAPGSAAKPARASSAHAASTSQAEAAAAAASGALSAVAENGAAAGTAASRRSLGKSPSRPVVPPIPLHKTEPGTSSSGRSASARASGTSPRPWR